MSLRSIVGQHFLIGISGHVLTSEEKKFIVENNIGGVCLFGRNVAEPKQVHELCMELQSLRFQQEDKAPLFIGIDMEGGRVHRLKAPFTVWPPLRKLGELDTPTVSFHFANRMGQEMKAVGINLDFAPCVDIFTNLENKVIGDRSIGSDPELVAKHASALVRGYIKSEIISCVKHFPGHGNTLLDSHEDLPVENIDKDLLDSREMIPFRKTFKARVDMVMTSHIQFLNIDPDWPVTLSEIFVTKILREELRYRGLIVTDDLGMKAMTKHFGIEEVPVRALQAGVDLLLYCNDPEVPPHALQAVLGALAQGSLQEKKMWESHQKILNFKKARIPHPDPLPLSEALQIIGSPENLNLAAAIEQGKVPEGLLQE